MLAATRERDCKQQRHSLESGRVPITSSLPHTIFGWLTRYSGITRSHFAIFILYWDERIMIWVGGGGQMQRSKWKNERFVKIKQYLSRSRYAAFNWRSRICSMWRMGEKESGSVVTVVITSILWSGGWRIQTRSYTIIRFIYICSTVSVNPAASLSWVRGGTTGSNEDLQLRIQMTLPSKINACPQEQLRAVMCRR
jgi:hypothetical protein